MKNQTRTRVVITASNQKGIIDGYVSLHSQVHAIVILDESELLVHVPLKELRLIVRII